MRLHLFLVGVILFGHHLVVGQSLYLLAKGGVSSYGAVYIGGLGGGGGGDHAWKTGPIVGAGIRIRTSGGFAVDGAIEYSTHRYASPAYETPPSNNPTNSVLEATAIGRSSLQILEPVHFGFLYGLGLSYQHRQEFEWSSIQSQHIKPSDTNVTGCVILGIAIEVRAPHNLEFTLEGCLRGRRYVTPVLMFGVAYLL
jgi:hypothetical protein